ncbi:MAG: peptidylprolyl isomerase [Alphaproteobacteria bacterium]|nr:peptidylprolyl isomerase [Alphaproteobacteria bacterium]
MSAPLRAKKKNNMVIYALLGLLVISLTGFGVRSVGSGGSQAIASVGDQEVTVDEYVTVLRAQLRGISQQFGTNITLEQALSFGIDAQVMSTVLNTAALDGENARIGLSVGDERVKANLLATPAFQAMSGSFDKIAYESALAQANLTPSGYDASIRKDTARNLLQTAVVSGINADDAYGLALFNYLGETRNFSWAVVDANLLDAPVPEPNAAQIDEQYKAAPEAYTAPEIRNITYVLLTPDMLYDTIKVDDETLLGLYKDQDTRFNKPDRRIVDRLVFATEAEAQDALDQITSGSKIFGDIVATRGLTLADVDMGQVEEADLSDAAGKAVFLLSEPGVVGPVDSELGPALFRVNAVLAAQFTSFEDAKAVLKREYVADQARRVVQDDVTNIDDLLAGGVSLEDIAAETAMNVASLKYVAGDTGEPGDIIAYDTFRTTAEAAQTGDFPEVLMLSDGGIFALRLDSITPPALIPLDEVTDKVITDWKAAQTRRQVLALADSYKARLGAGETFTDLGLVAKAEVDLRRDQQAENAPADLVTTVFEADPDAVQVIEDSAQVVLSQLTKITPFDPKAEASKTILANVAAQFSTQLGNDVIEAFTTALRDEAGITVNQPLIDAVHRQIP